MKEIMVQTSKHPVILLYRHIIVFVLLPLLLVPSARAQEDLGIQLIFPQNPSPYLSDWNDGSMTARLVVTNQSENTYFVTFMLSLRRDEQDVIRSVAEHMPVEMIQPGVHVFEAADFLIYEAYQFAGGFEEQVSRTGKLPAGLYDICIQVFEVERQYYVSGIVCQKLIVADYQPPRLMQPPDGISLRPGEIPLFYFTPVLPPVQPGSTMYPVEYRLVVMEIFKDQSPMDAFLSNMPVVEVYIQEQTRLFWPPDFELPEPGMRYVWSVQAIDANGNPVGQNEGWAAPYMFELVAEDEPSTAEFPLVVLNLNNMADLVERLKDHSLLKNLFFEINGLRYAPGTAEIKLPPGLYEYRIFIEKEVLHKGVLEITGMHPILDLTVTIPVPDLSDDSQLIMTPSVMVGVTDISGVVVALPVVSTPPDTTDVVVAPPGITAPPDTTDVVVVPPGITAPPDTTDVVVVPPGITAPPDTTDVVVVPPDITTAPDSSDVVVVPPGITAPPDTTDVVVVPPDITTAPDSSDVVVVPPGITAPPDTTDVVVVPPGITAPPDTTDVVVVPPGITTAPDSTDVVMVPPDITTAPDSSDVVVVPPGITTAPDSSDVVMVPPGITTAPDSSDVVVVPPGITAPPDTTDVVVVPPGITTAPDSTDTEGETIAPPSDTETIKECVCSTCSIQGLKVLKGDSESVIMMPDPLIVGDTYSFVPVLECDCPPDCPLQFIIEAVFRIYDANGVQIAEHTTTGAETFSYMPRRSGDLVVTLHAKALCGESECACGTFSITFQVLGRTIAEGITGVPLDKPDERTETPPGVSGPGGDIETPPGTTGDPKQPGITGPPPEYPPRDPEEDGCDPSIDKDAGLPIVLNVYLEEEEKFLYPRAVPLHALGIDWDFAYFLCTDCDGSVSRHRYPVMDKVSTYSWRLQGKGSLNEPFTAQEIITLEEQIAALVKLLEEKETLLKELEAKITALPDDTKARQERAKKQIEEIESLNETIKNEIDTLQTSYDQLEEEYGDAHQRAIAIREEIQSVEEDIKAYSDIQKDLEEKLKNNPTQEELSQMEEVEKKREEFERKTQLVWDIEQDIINNKESLLNDIQQSLHDLGTAIDSYNQLNFQIDTTQQQINRVLRQVYGVPVNRTLMDRLREWNESANHYLIYLLDTLNQSHEQIQDMASLVNEVQRNSSLLMFMADTLVRKQMGNTIKQGVDQFVSLAGQRCYQLAPGQPSGPCLSKMYWVSQRNRPLQNAVDSVLDLRPEFTAQHLHLLDSLRQALSGYESGIQNLRSQVELRNQAYLDALEHFSTTMERLEDDKSGAIDERIKAERVLLEAQTELLDMIDGRNAVFAENEPGFIMEYNQTDSIIAMAGVELSIKLRRLGTAMADSVDLHMEMTLLEEEMDKKRESVEANEQVIETLQKILDIDIDALLAELNKEKEALEEEIETMKEQLKQLLERVEELKEGDQKNADGPMVYYIPPPLEIVMKDSARFEELKKDVIEAELDYLEAIAYKAGLQPEFSLLLEGISRNLSSARAANEKLEDLEQQAEELSEAFEKMEKEKKDAYEKEKEALDSVLSEEKQKLEQYGGDVDNYSNESARLAGEIEDLEGQIPEKANDLREQTESLREQQALLDSLGSVSGRQALRLRALSDSIRTINAKLDGQQYDLEAARDQLTRAISAENAGLEAQAKKKVDELIDAIDDTAEQLNDLTDVKNLLSEEHAAIVVRLEREREELDTKQVELYNAARELDELTGDLYRANKELKSTRQKLLEAQGKVRNSEALVEDLEREAGQFPALSEMLGSDQELQDANQSSLVAEREKQKMEDVRERSKANIEKNLEEKERLEEEARRKLEEAILRKDNADNELRQFLLDEFNNVEFADTLYITAFDDVLDQWRTRDDSLQVMAIIKYDLKRTPELEFTEQDVPEPVRDDLSIGSCEVDVAALEGGGISPVSSNMLGPEPRTIALIYENGRPLWPEWPVITKANEPLAESVVRVRAGGSDSDIFEHYCSSKTDNCLDPPQIDYPVADVLHYQWSGDGAFFNEQKYSDFILWEPGKVTKPECDEEQKIETQYQASTVVGDPAEERVSLQTVYPGVMIEVTDTLMGFPDHQRDALARIVKGDYKGLSGEVIEFTVRLIEGKSEGWGFGGDTVYAATTDHLGYAKAPFDFGDGFARFEFDVRWLREQGNEPSCETGKILALSPLYLGIHYFGYSADDPFLSGAKEIWEGADADGVLAELPAPAEEEEKPLLAMAGLLDHNRDFVNEKDLHFSLKDPGNGDTGLMVDPETNTTELFGIAHTFVTGEVEEGLDLSVGVEPDEEYQPVCIPPKDERKFSTSRGKRFKIGKDNDLFVIVADEPFSPFEPVNGTGRIEVSAGGQVMMVLRDLELNIVDVMLEIRGQDTVAIDGRVSWHASGQVAMDIQNFSFGLDSLVLLPARGGGLGGSIKHTTLTYPVRFYAEVGTDGDFYGEVMELPEIELADFKLHKGTNLVIDWSSARSPGGLDEAFKGIVVRQASLDMPPVFRSSGDKEPSTLTTQDFAIGSTGVHGNISLSGAPVQIGYAGFELVGDGISLTFKDSEVESFDIKGIFRFPKPMEGGIIASVGKQGDTGWSLELETENPITIPKFKTTFALNSGTGVAWDAESETGTATINASVSSDYFSDIEIVGLEVNNKGLFKVEAINVDVGLTISGGFDLRANTIAFSIGSDEVDDFVRVDGKLGLNLIAETKISGAIVVSSGPNVDFIFEDGSIEFKRGPVDFKGSFAYNSREFRGDFDIDIKNMVGMKALLIVGSMPVDAQNFYSYWYAELVLKAVVPLGQSGLSLLELGGGLGFNYQPPIGSQQGMPVENKAFALKAIIAIGNSAIPPARPGTLFKGRMEMVLMPELFMLNGKAWVLEKENSIFGEGQLNLRWGEQTRIDGFVRSYIALADTEGKILLFNGKINYDFHAAGFIIQSEEISGTVFQKVKGEASVLFTQQQIAMSGRVSFDASAEVNVVVATLQAYIHTQAAGSMTYNNAQSRMQASVGLAGNWGISADTFLGEVTVFKGAVAIDASVDASPQYIRFDANAVTEWTVLWHSGTAEFAFGFEI